MVFGSSATVPFMAEGILEYTLEGGVAIARMDDGKANALSVPMIDAISTALARAESEASAFVLVGRPERFSGGFDLKVMMSGPENATALLERGSDLFMKLYASPVPVVAACTGHALAGGALLLCCADLRIGADGPFKIGLNEVSIGLPVPDLAMELARDRIAPKDLARATLFAEIFDPKGAAGVGYLDQVVAPGELLDVAKREAARLGALSRRAFSATKERLRGATIRHIRENLEADMKALLSPA
jgi:enoyl-CoA hydratase